MIERDSFGDYTKEEFEEWLEEEGTSLEEDLLTPEDEKKLHLMAQSTGRSCAYILKYCILLQYKAIMNNDLVIPDLTYTDKASVRAFNDIMLSKISCRR